jgi:hypothetical protein
MFKYISEILSKFNDNQRIIALIVVLFSIITILIGPKMVESLTYDDSEMKLKITTQNTEISMLNGRINELTYQIITNQRECVDEIIRRETEILEMINEIDLRVRKSKNEIRVLKYEPPTTIDTIHNNEQNLLLKSLPQQTTIIENKRDEKLIKMINEVKEKLSNDING